VTGASLIVALQALQQKFPRMIVVALAVAPPDDAPVLLDVGRACARINVEHDFFVWPRYKINVKCLEAH